MSQLEKGAMPPPILETNHPKDMKKGTAMRSLYAILISPLLASLTGSLSPLDK